MKLYNPKKTTEYIDLPADPKDSLKLFLDKYKAEAERIQEDLNTPGSKN